MSHETIDLPSINDLPSEKLPHCWNDEERINVLFAPFRNRSVNPKDYETKLEFWKNLLSVYCDYHKVYIFKTSLLIEAFKKDGRTPSCLGDVINELLKSGDLQPLDRFFQKPSETWTAWATDTLIKRPIIWSFKKLKESLISTEKDQVYVHLPSIHKHSINLFNLVTQNQSCKIIDFYELSSLNTANSTTLNLLLHHLIKQGKASVKDLKSNVGTESTLLIKFGNIKVLGGLTELEVDVYVLQQSEKTLTNNIQKLEEEISKLIQETKSHLLKGHKQTAKTCLRKKKELDVRVGKIADALYNIQTLLSRVQDATMNAQVLETYKSALTSLRTTFKENGLTEENVTTTMIEIGEVLDIHDDIQHSLAQPINETDIDLEQELADLLRSNINDGNTGSNGPKEKENPVIGLEKSFDNLSIKLPDVPFSPTSRKMPDFAQ